MRFVGIDGELLLLLSRWWHSPLDVSVGGIVSIFELLNRLLLLRLLLMMLLQSPLWLLLFAVELASSSALPLLLPLLLVGSKELPSQRYRSHLLLWSPVNHQPLSPLINGCKERRSFYSESWESRIELLRLRKTLTCGRIYVD